MLITYDSLFIGGEWVRPGSAARIDVTSASTEELIGSVPEADPKPAHAAIAAARRAFDDGPWPRTSPRQRAATLRRMAEILDERHDQLKELVMAESGSEPRQEG